MARSASLPPHQFVQFGELLKYLRRREGLTQRDLSIAVGYSDSQISRLEHNQRVPDRATLTALFITALHLEYEPEWTTPLLELASEARSAEGPAPHTTQAPIPPHNLPSQLTSFLGREKEISQVVRSLSPPSATSDSHPELRARMVTLTGPGGVGKTRLAIQVALHLLAAYPDGVWMVDLAPLVDPNLVPQTVAAMFGVREEGREPTLSSLTTVLQSKIALLLLDNCEHLIGACAHMADATIQACPAVSILATSREALGIIGEISFSIEPLSLPETNPAIPMQTLLEYDAVRLFTERARAAFPGFEITPANSWAIVEVCRRLDGLPLAIELAAARVKVFSVEQISARLDDAFHLLSGGSRTAQPRSQTLRACFDWSYNLLFEGERLLLRRLTVFTGSWTLEGAESVCSDERISSSEVFNLLAQLVEKSLVVVDRMQSSGSRYRFLETIYRYARDKQVNPGELEAIRNKHLEYFLHILEAANFEIGERDQVDWLNRIEAEHSNLRAALEWILTSDNDNDITFRLASRLADFWEYRGYLEEGRRWLAVVLSSPGAQAPSMARAELLYKSAWLAIGQSDRLAGLILLEESRNLFDQFRPAGMLGLANVLSSLAAIEIDSGEAEIAYEHAQRELLIAEEIDDRAGVSWAHRMQGLALGHLGEYAQAWDHLEISLSLNRRMGRSLISPLLTLGELALRQEDYERGKSYLDECVRLSVEAGNKWSIAAALGRLSWIAIRQGEFGQAKRLLQESMDLRKEIDDKGGLAWCLEKLAECAVLQGSPEKAARILGSADSLRIAVNSPVNSADRSEYNRLLESLKEQIGQAEFQSAWEAGAAMRLDAVTSQKVGVWGVLGGRSPPKTPHTPLFIEMLLDASIKLALEA